MVTLLIQETDQFKRKDYQDIKMFIVEILRTIEKYRQETKKYLQSHQMRENHH